MTVSLAGAAWTVYFAALAAVYLTAFHHRAASPEAAAGWGLAIAFAAALLTVPYAVSWIPVARTAGHPAARTWAWAAAGLLAAASVAVIWVAVNLTLASNSAGAWGLTVCAAAAPVTLLATRLTLRPPPAVTTPPAVVVALPEPVSVVVAPPAVLTPPPADLAEHAQDVAGAPEARPTGVDASLAAAHEVGTLDPGVTATLLEPPVPEVDPRKRVDSPPLLVPDWAERLGSRPPKVAVDAGMWEAVLASLGKRRQEVGGVALTVRMPGTLIVLGLVLPKQVQATGVFCEFRSDEVIRVRDAIDGVADILDLDPTDVKITWVHTHPGMGPFLSGTDQATTDTWRAFDPEFTPIVLDPLAERLSRQIGVFDTDNRKIEQLRVVDGLVDQYAVGLLRDELVDAYRDAKGTMVLFGAG